RVFGTKSVWNPRPESDSTPPTVVTSLLHSKPQSGCQSASSPVIKQFIVLGVKHVTEFPHHGTHIRFDGKGFLRFLFGSPTAKCRLEMELPPAVRVYLPLSCYRTAYFGNKPPNYVCQRHSVVCTGCVLGHLHLGCSVVVCTHSILATTCCPRF